MKKKKYGGSWTKPRFNRSRLKIVKDTELSLQIDHGSLTEDKATKWKAISEKTFHELVDKDALSPEQIRCYEEKLVTKELEKIGSNFKTHKDYELILKLSNHNISTKDGAKKIGKILRENPKAGMLLGRAHDLKKLRKSLRK